MNLSPHFTLEELTVTELRQYDNTPDTAAIANLARVADLLEQVRDVCAAPIFVNSGYRSLAVNRAVGGQLNSQHLKGCAADIHIPPYTPDMIIQKIMTSGLPFDQLIREFDRWVHISVPNIVGDMPRKQVLIIDSKGTRPYAS